MRQWTLLAAMLLVALGWTRPVHAQTTVRVVETWPAGDRVVLGPNQSFYLRLAYDSAEPVRIWARPYFRGEPVTAGSNPSGVHVGSGEALGWFFFMEPGLQVDEIRISAGNGSPGGTPVLAVWRGRITAGGAASSASEPGWVVELRQQAAAAHAAARDEAMRRPIGAGERLMVGGFALGMLGLGVLGLCLPAWALWQWRGGWRLAAAVPAALMGFVVARILVGVLIDPTSHNLWPFEILLAGVPSVVAMGVLLLARRWQRNRP